LLRLELLELSILPVDLSLLRGYLLLHILFLLLARLHLVANQRASNKTNHQVMVHLSSPSLKTESAHSNWSRLRE
jgi:hypothetical protein